MDTIGSVPGHRASAQAVYRDRAPKMSELIAAHLRHQIVSGALRAGDTLPPENELLTHFDVSRPTLREAFRILEAESLVSVLRGKRGGAQVTVPDLSGPGVPVMTDSGTLERALRRLLAPSRSTETERNASTGRPRAHDQG